MASHRGDADAVGVGDLLWSAAGNEGTQDLCLALRQGVERLVQGTFESAETLDALNERQPLIVGEGNQDQRLRPRRRGASALNLDCCTRLSRHVEGRG